MKDSDIRALHEAIIPPVGLCGCKTWSLTRTFREECRLRVLENRILRQIFVYKWDHSGEWRRLQNEGHSPNIARVKKAKH